MRDCDRCMSRAVCGVCVRHSNGENALKVLPHLVDFIPEAKLNLVRLLEPLS